MREQDRNQEWAGNVLQQTINNASLSENDEYQWSFLMFLKQQNRYSLHTGLPE